MDVSPTHVIISTERKILPKFPFTTALENTVSKAQFLDLHHPTLWPALLPQCYEGSYPDLPTILISIYSKELFSFFTLPDNYKQDKINSVQKANMLHGSSLLQQEILAIPHRAPEVTHSAVEQILPSKTEESEKWT